MKAQTLQNAIKKLKKVISPRNTLPVLDNIFNDNGTLTASDLENTHTVNVGFPGRFLVDAKELSRILDKLPKDADVIITGDETTLRIVIAIAGMGEFKLTGTNPEDFPVNPTVEIPIGGIISGDVTTMRIAAKFTSDDELRPVMTGVYLEKKIVASDARKLVYYDYSQGLKRPVLITHKSVGLLDLRDYTAYSDKENKNIKLVNDDETIIIRQIEGNYPNYDAVIPKNNKIVYMAENKRLQETVKLAMVAANEASGLIRFNFSGSTLRVTSQDLDFDRSFTRDIAVKHSSKEKGPIEVGMKGQFLLSLLAEANETVRFAFKDSSGAILIDNNKLLMPMMLNS